MSEEINDKVGQICDTIVLLAKSETRGLMPQNEYCQAIEKLSPNIRTYFISPNQFVFTNLNNLALAISKTFHDFSHSSTGIVFTSKRCIDAFSLALELLPNDFDIAKIGQAKIFTVGQGTKQYLLKKLNLNSIGESCGSSEKLANFILEQTKQDNLKILLYPCSQIRTDSLMTILKPFIQIEEIVCYETVENEHLDQELIEFRTDFFENQFKNFLKANAGATNKLFEFIVVFFSPSGVRNLLEKLQHRFSDLSIIITSDGQVNNEHQQDDDHSTKSKNESNQNLSKLSNWLNKNMKIQLSDNRIILGVFLCTDCHQNIILGSSLEYLSEQDEDPRVLGLAMVPGEHIISIHVDEIVPS